MLLYRLPEAQLVKLINPFLLDPVSAGGLGLSTSEVGIVYGTVGIIGLTLGGIAGGLVAARRGLNYWLRPMAWSMSLTCLTFVYLSWATSPSLLTINACVFIEQFGYGFGFTAYMLYLYIFFRGQILHGPLQHMHRLYGPRHDAPRHGCWMDTGHHRLPLLLHMDNDMLHSHHRCVTLA